MTRYDLGLAWNWEHDADFVLLLDTALQAHHLSLLQITPANLDGILQALIDKALALSVFFDRASDTDAGFLPLVRWACDHIPYHINQSELARRAWDKEAMHQALSLILHTPQTIIISSYNEQPILPPVDLGILGPSFSVKPAHGGGGTGVVIGATSLEQVLVARQEYPADKYLLQAHVTPVLLGSRSAWFRVLYCTGQVYPCWWDPRTHVYVSVTSAEENDYRLAALREMAISIAHVCQLELFSTEIALTPDGLFVVVDYVNDPIDLRLQSKAADGVPDHVVRDIAERLVALVSTWI